MAAHYHCGSNNHSSSLAAPSSPSLPAYAAAGSTRSHWRSGRDLAATASSSSFFTRHTSATSSTTSPALVVHGWELDPAVVEAARSCMGMDEMERQGQLVGGGQQLVGTEWDHVAPPGALHSTNYRKSTL